MLWELGGLSLFRYTVCTHRDRHDRKSTKQGSRDGQKRKEKGERQGEICFLFTSGAQATKQQAARPLLTGTTGMTIHTNTHYHPSPASSVITQKRFSPKLSYPSFCLGDIWRLVVCSWFHVSLLSLLWPAAVLTGSSLEYARPQLCAQTLPEKFPSQDRLPSNSTQRAISSC